MYEEGDGQVVRLFLREEGVGFEFFVEGELGRLCVELEPDTKEDVDLLDEEEPEEHSFSWREPECPEIVEAIEHTTEREQSQRERKHREEIGDYNPK